MRKKDFHPEDYPRLTTKPHNRKYSQHSEVRYSVIEEEDHSKVTLIVIGACTKLVHDIVRWMWGRGVGLFRKASVRTHIPIHFLNRHHRREIWVDIVPDYQKCGLDDLCLIFESQFRTKTDCTIKKVKMETLINQ
ncbi:MAG: hypothetical protein MJZ30_07630 [Paludibacteraceae bacterium]|nr:hypothetical protein [Paludibacteraceae bacterium]